MAEADNAKRVALVIGNAEYAHAGLLANPANDARGMAERLAALEFSVHTGIDLARDPMENALFEFEAQIRNADVALLFYAGHGLQVKGENYLIPVDANIEMEMHLKRRAFSLSEVLGVMSERTSTNLVFLDACRNNPFTRSLSRALGLTENALCVEVWRRCARRRAHSSPLPPRRTRSRSTAGAAKVHSRKRFSSTSRRRG